MKKILFLTAILAFAATSSFAGNTQSSPTGTIDFAITTYTLVLHGDAGTATDASTLIGRCSTGVDVAWKTATGGYALMTQHKSGTKAYATSYDSTAMFMTTNNITPGSPAYASGALSKTDSSNFTTANNWKAM